MKVGGRQRMQSMTWGVAAAVPAAALVLALGGLGQPVAVSAASPSPDPCDVIPGDCATITLTVSGNGVGALYTGDEILNCHRENGSTTGTCFHRYYVGSDTVPWSIYTSPGPGSLACNGDSCAPLGGVKGGLLHPGDTISQETEFRLIATPVPTVTPAPTLKPTPRATKTPTPTLPPSAAPTGAAPTEGPAGSPSSEPSAEVATPEDSASALSAAPSSPPTEPAANTGASPSIVILVLGALLIGAAGFAGGYATALRRR